MVVFFGRQNIGHWSTTFLCVQLIDTCYTFSPLTSEYSRGGDSEETLVTHVSCYGDLGGWLSRRHPWRRLLRFLAPIASDSLNSFLCPLIESSIAIRNKVPSASARSLFSRDRTSQTSSACLPLVLSVSVPGGVLRVAAIL